MAVLDMKLSKTTDGLFIILKLFYLPGPPGDRRIIITENMKGTTTPFQLRLKNLWVNSMEG
jgi:hypothetical protein